ncbi:MAG TPA: rhomboid family intramembrane serine protease [Candidatus Bathyarchaeia archaeon]|nr:rhomboid family intramembrane serine protease [Candidatus Bathyarchaeia archaeon]
MNKINLVIIACILVSLYYWFGGQADSTMQYFAFSTANLLNGRSWTLVTALFLHADILHLAGNMIFLYAFGNALEKEVGAGKTYLAFFAGGILSFLLGVFFYDPSVFMVGASAAIFTLTAVVMLVKPLKFSFIFLMPLGLVAIIYIIYNVVAVQSGVEGNIAYISHVIGFAIGVPFGIAWTKNLVKNLLITLGLLILYIFITIVLLPYILQALGI